MTGALYYGDNLQVLRDEIASATVDLVYLDPPFNSNASYNLLFRARRFGKCGRRVPHVGGAIMMRPSAADDKASGMPNEIG